MHTRKIRYVLKRPANWIAGKLAIGGVLARDRRSGRLVLDVPLMAVWSYSAVQWIEGLEVFPPFTWTTKVEATLFVAIVAICAIGMNASGPSEDSPV